MSAPSEKIICIFGNSRCRSDAAEYQEAEKLGRWLAEANYTVCTGGYDGIMEAASRTARLVGGEVIGVTVDIFKSSPNTYLTREIRVPDLFTRLKTMTELASGFIGLRGSIGTVTEVALVWNLLVIGCLNPPKPFVLVGSSWQRVVEAWSAHLAVDGRDLPHVKIANTAEEACQWLQEQLNF
jgi:hypothetical protein